MKLALDTSSNKVAISVEDRGNIYCKYSEGDFSQAEEIAILLQELCRENNLLLKNIKEIYCVIGPGSFTAVRVLVAFVKGFSIDSDIKIYPISKFYYMLANIASELSQIKGFEVLINCQKEKKEFFYQKISNDYKVVSEAKIISFDEVVLNSKENYLISDYDFQKKDKLIKNFFYIRANDLKIELIFRLPPIINYYRLEPLYVRAPYVG